ncbi:MAG: hypothetical protein ACW99A_23985, partial [Candidatus Kariarchaeaceae archaeon]|jgi:hypothetical protein
VNIVPNTSRKFREKYSVFRKDENFPKETLDPLSKSDAYVANDLIKNTFGKLSKRILTYLGTSQNGKSTSIKCGFSGRLEKVKDDYLSVVYTAESILNSKNSSSLYSRIDIEFKEFCFFW